MKTWMQRWNDKARAGGLAWLVMAVVAVTAMGLPHDAEAKRLGGGKSQGLQRNMPERTAPAAAPAVPPSPAPTAVPNANPATAAAAAAPARRSWMGPLAGLAAGLGLAALFSHFGMGEGMGNIVMMALLAVGAFMLIRFAMSRWGGAAARSPALAGAGAGAGGPVATPWRSEPVLTRVAQQPAAADAAPAAVPATTPLRPAAVFVPASFDSEGFTRIAKMIFIRMQTANDAADLDDLRRFTTPEMFASIRLDIQDRASKPQTTDVVKVDAEVLDLAQEDSRQIVSVRFRGQVVEEKGAAPASFDEVWHLARPQGADDAGWVIAGIEQMA